MVRPIEGTIWVDLEEWRPSRGWTEMVSRAAAMLEKDRASKRGWAALVMMLGDSGAADLALIACLHAQRLPGAGVHDRGLAAQGDVCLLQLGLARPRTPGLIPIVKFGSPDLLDTSKVRLEAWLAQQLRPFDGNLESAAEFILQLALARAGLRHDEPPL